MGVPRPALPGDLTGSVIEAEVLTPEDEFFRVVMCLRAASDF